jgi:hypothetical protein
MSDDGGFYEGLIAMQEEFEKIVNECPYETRLAVTAWVFRHLVDHATDGGSFRYLIYQRLGFAQDAYVPLCDAGGLTISNEFSLSEDKEKATDAEITAVSPITSVTDDDDILPPEEAAILHARLVSGEMKIEIGDDVAKEIDSMGITPEDLRDMLTQAAKKSLS